MADDDQIQMIYETVECPYCGHPAQFAHEKDQYMGVIWCPNCDAEGY